MKILIIDRIKELLKSDDLTQSKLASGIGSNFRVFASSMDTAARNMITVILSINIESTPDISIKHMRSEVVL